LIHPLKAKTMLIHPPPLQPSQPTTNQKNDQNISIVSNWHFPWFCWNPEMVLAVLTAIAIYTYI
jgi:hypothetical protein